MTQPNEEGFEPIMAHFIPQQWRGDIAMTVDGERDFDATVHVLSLKTWQINELRDHDYSSDEIARSAGLLEEHDGPFEVEIERSLESFFDVDDVSEITEQQVEDARARHHDRQPMNVDGPSDGAADGGEFQPTTAAEAHLGQLPDSEVAEMGPAIDRRELVGFKSSYGVCVLTDAIDDLDFPRLYRLTKQARDAGFDWLFLRRNTD